jgi:hypothetical protein
MKKPFLLILIIVVTEISFGQTSDVYPTQNNSKEFQGNHDNLHYLANYLEPKLDTLEIRYSYDLCLCPKWNINGTNEKIWIESSRDSVLTNYSDRELNQTKVKVIGQFYKYKGVPLGLYDFGYLKEKSVPNARIFKIKSKAGE